MPGAIAVHPTQHFDDAAGAPLVGGTLTTYVSGTVTPANTWQDRGQTTLNLNPIVLNARGECVVWLDPAVTYTWVLKTAAGVEIWTRDNIVGAASAAVIAALEASVAAIAARSGVELEQHFTGAGPWTLTGTVVGSPTKVFHNGVKKRLSSFSYDAGTKVLTKTDTTFFISAVDKIDVCHV